MNYHDTTNTLVFKTSIKLKKQIDMLCPLMDKLDGCVTWSVDREDCDHVLRVVSRGITDEMVIKLIQQMEFSCETLPCDPTEV